MRVLVTGGCGFIGSWACEYYIKRGAEVISFDNLTKYELRRTGYSVKDARYHNYNFLKELGVKLITGDIRNKEELLEWSKGCNFIIHTAAQPAMTISIEKPELDFSTNTLGTLNVLEVARLRNIPIVNCSTIHVYGNQINEELKEDQIRYTREPTEINEDYSNFLKSTITPLHASKYSAEIYTKVYIDTYHLKAASFRLTGLYGPRQFGGEDHGWVANFCIRAILDIPIKIYGTGKQVRDILYAEDVAKAFDAFYNNPQPGIYNIGGSRLTAISLLECIELISSVLRKKLKVEFLPERLGDLRYFVCDITRAREILKWQPQVQPEKGVNNLIDWVEENKEIFEHKE